MTAKYRFQVCLDAGTKDERWADVHPVGGAPYEYGTRAEAESMARLCYGTDASIVRVRDASDWVCSYCDTVNPQGAEWCQHCKGV